MHQKKGSASATTDANTGYKRAPVVIGGGIVKIALGIYVRDLPGYPCDLVGCVVGSLFFLAKLTSEIIAVMRREYIKN